MPPNKRKPYRILTNVKISEVSSVDAGAAPGARIMLRKRADRERAVLKAKLDRATAALAVSRQKHRQ
jgi:hypothetical protein